MISSNTTSLPEVTGNAGIKTIKVYKEVLDH